MEAEKSFRILVLSIIVLLVFAISFNAYQLGRSVAGSTVALPTITVTASGKAEVVSEQHVVSGYLHFYEEDGALSMSKADEDMVKINTVITEFLGDYDLFDETDTFNNWGGEDCIKCGKKFGYTAERGFSVRCPDWETMVKLQSRLAEDFSLHNFRANSLPSDESQSIGDAVNVAIKNATRQAEVATGYAVSLVSTTVTQSSIDPDVNYNFANATVEVVFSFNPNESTTQN